MLTFTRNRLINRPNPPRCKVLRGYLRTLGYDWPEPDPKKKAVEGDDEGDDLDDQAADEAEEDYEVQEGQEDMEEEIGFEDDPALEPVQAPTAPEVVALKDPEVHAAAPPDSKVPVVTPKDMAPEVPSKDAAPPASEVPVVTAEDMAPEVASEVPVVPSKGAPLEVASNDALLASKGPSMEKEPANMSSKPNEYPITDLRRWMRPGSVWDYLESLKPGEEDASAAGGSAQGSTGTSTPHLSTPQPRQVQPVMETPSPVTVPYQHVFMTGLTC